MVHFNDLLIIINRKDGYGNAVPFSITYTQADVKRNTGGKEVTFPAVVKYGGEGSEQLKANSEKLPDGGLVGTIGKSKAPHHAEHETINIQILPSKQIKTLHLRLVTDVNNERVYW